MSQEVMTFPYNDLEKILSTTCSYFGKNEFLEECELYAKRLRPLYSSNLEEFFSSLLENYIYGDYRDQVPFLNKLIEALVNLIRPRNKLCVKDKSGGTAEEIVEYMISCLIRDGLIPCFVNSILINNRLSRIQRNFNFMGLESNWISNSNVYSFIREKDYWINSEYTSNKTPSSLQVAADDKPESLTESVIPENPAFTRKALKRPASHDLPDEELEWLRGTSVCSNKDLPHSVEQNLSENSLRMNNPCKTSCLVCRHKTLRQSKDCREISKTRNIANELPESTRNLRKKSISSLRSRSLRSRKFSSFTKHEESEKEEHSCGSKPRNNNAGEEENIEGKKQVSYVSIIIKEDDDTSKANYSEEIRCDTVENLAVTSNQSKILLPVEQLENTSRNTAITSGAPQRSKVSMKWSVEKSQNYSENCQDKSESTIKKISLGSTCTRNVCLKPQGTLKSFSFGKSDLPKNDPLRNKDLMNTQKGILQSSILKNSHGTLKSSLNRSCLPRNDLRSIDKSQVLSESLRLENSSKVTCLKQPQASFNSSCLKKLQETAIKTSLVKNEILTNDNEEVQRSLKIYNFDKLQASTRNTCHGKSQFLKSTPVKSEGPKSDSEVLPSLQIGTQNKLQASTRNTCYGKSQCNLNSKLENCKDVSRCEGMSPEALRKSHAEKPRTSKRNSCFEKSLSTVNESLGKSEDVSRRDCGEHPKTNLENSSTAARKSCFGWPQKSNLNQTSLIKFEDNSSCGNDKVSHCDLKRPSLNKPQTPWRNISFAKAQNLLHSTPLSWSEDSSRCDCSEESKGTFLEKSQIPSRSKTFSDNCQCTAQNTLQKKSESSPRCDYKEKTKIPEKSAGTVKDTNDEESQLSSGSRICVRKSYNRLQNSSQDKCEQTLRCSCGDQTKHTCLQTSRVSSIPKVYNNKSQSSLRNIPTPKTEDAFRCDNEEKSEGIVLEKSQPFQPCFSKPETALEEKLEDTARCDCGEKAVKSTFVEKPQLSSGSRICVRQSYNNLQKSPCDKSAHALQGVRENQMKSTCLKMCRESSRSKINFGKSCTNLRNTPQEKVEETLTRDFDEKSKGISLEKSSTFLVTPRDQLEDHSTCNCGEVEEVPHTSPHMTCPHLDQSLRESPRQESSKSKIYSGKSQITLHNTRRQAEGCVTCNCEKFSRNTFGNKSRICLRNVHSEFHEPKNTSLDENFTDSNWFENLQCTLKLQPSEKAFEKISLDKSSTSKTGLNKSQVYFDISLDRSQEAYFAAEDEMPCCPIKSEKQLKENIEVKCVPDAETESIFDVVARLELSPYVDADNSELMTEIRELLCPILCDRNQEYPECLEHVSFHSIGLQTEPKQVSHKEVSRRVSEKHLKNICKCLNPSMKTKMHSLNASGDFAYPIVKNTGISVQKFSSFEKNSKLRSSISKIYECKNETASRPINVSSSKKIAYPVKKKVRRKRRKKSRKKEYKTKRSVIADFLCLPFTHVIRDMVYKVLTERDEESSDNNKRKGNCRDGFQDPPNLKIFDSSYEDCHCSPRLDRKPFISCIKKPTDINVQTQVSQRLAGGSCELFQKSSTQRKVVRPRSNYRKSRIRYCKRRSCVCENENNSSYIQTHFIKSAREDDSEIYSSYTRDCLTIYSRSINTSISSDSYADVESWCSTKRFSPRSSRRFTGCYRNEETRCVDCDIEYGGTMGMRNVERRRTVCALPDENRSARYHSLREYKNHEPCHCCSDSFDKSGRRADTQPAGSSSKNQSHPERCSHRAKHKSAFNGQQHVEPEIIFDSRFQEKCLHL